MIEAVFQPAWNGIEIRRREMRIGERRHQRLDPLAALAMALRALRIVKRFAGMRNAAVRVDVQHEHDDDDNDGERRKKLEMFHYTSTALCICPPLKGAGG